MKNNFFKTYFLVISITFFVLLFDMLTKYILIPTLIPQVGDVAPFIEGFINFVHVQNKGASWGILSGQMYFLIIISVLILVGILWLYIKKINNEISKNNVLISITVGFLVGGCLGNLYDRIVFGYVRDFINFEFIDFPVFNIADCAITVGVILFVIYIILDYVKAIKTEKKLKNEHADNNFETEEFKEKLTETLIRDRNNNNNLNNAKKKNDINKDAKDKDD